MTLRSMTGFGRSTGVCEEIDWSWELRAVNGKGLDIRTRLPHGFDHLEPLIRKSCGSVLSRGNVQATLSLKRNSSESALAVNQHTLKRILDVLEEIEQHPSVTKSSGAEILALRGVLEVADTELDDEQVANLEQSFLAGFEEALGELVQNRSREGTDLSSVLLGQVKKVEQLSKQAEDDPTRSNDAIVSRLRQQLSKFDDLAEDIDRDRLYQEVAMLATRSDIREELDRLKAHAVAARGLIENGSPVGRKLEFLGQELNRETNTLCSKASTASLTDTGLALKVVIDQFREQILNVE